MNIQDRAKFCLFLCEQISANKVCGNFDLHIIIQNKQCLQCFSVSSSDLNLGIFIVAMHNDVIYLAKDADGCAIERGERKPTLDTFFKIADALGVKPSIIMAAIEEELEKK